MADRAVDFFVSYTSADKPWAEWVVSELEHAGYSTVWQAHDMPAGSNFVLEMNDAARGAARTVAVLSPASLASDPCRVEWSAALREDFDGTRRKLVPVRVRECDPGGVFGSIVYIDVVDLTEQASSAALLAGVRAGCAKEADAPSFLVQQQLGESEAARASQQRAPAIFEAVYGPEHPNVASTLGNLGSPRPPPPPLADHHTWISRHACRRDSHHAASCTIRARVSPIP